MTLDDIAFAPGKAALRREARDNLNKVVAFVNQDPRKSIHVEGHTDSRGNPNANQLLSQRRAEAVREIGFFFFFFFFGLVCGPGFSVPLNLRTRSISASVQRQNDLSPTAIGLGAEQPVASNDSDEGRAKNRRVDVILEDR